MTDLVGSTATRVEVGEERAETLRREHDAMIRSVVEATDGTFVKNTGDGALAWFPSAADAVTAAIRLQRRLDGLRVSSPDGAWAMRVGVSLGDVTLEDDGDVFGAPVVEAARLCAAADAGEILSVDLVRVMARGRAGDVFVPKGELALKGVPEPVMVCAVRWNVRTDTASMSALLATRTETELVGRDEQLVSLGAAWDDAVGGRVTVALVSGEPGIGKTRLVSEFARAQHPEGAVALAGRCDEELGAPFAPFAEALRHLVAETPERELRAQLGGCASLVARIVPSLGEKLPDLEPAAGAGPEVERAEFVDAVIGWLAAVSMSAPVVLVLDDLHWADAPSLSLLRALARDGRPARVLVLGTYREIELARTHPLSSVLAEFRRTSAVTRLSLDGLAEADVATMIERVGDEGTVPDDPELALALRDATDGNPFFVLEMVRHLNENEWRVLSTSAPGTEHTAARFSLPEGVREVIGERLSRLSDDANELLRVAAVVGRTFDFAVLSAVTGENDERILDLLSEAIDARLVAEAGGVIDLFEFTHALVQETLRTEVPTSQRVRLHRRIAEAIEGLAGVRVDARLGELAFHYGEAAVSGCIDEAIEYAQQAAENAMGALAFEDAVLYLERALATARLRDDVDPIEQAVLQRARADAYFALRDEDRAESSAQAAIAAAREGGLAASGEFAQAAILLWQLGTYRPRSQLTRLVPILQEALAGLDERAVATRIELLDVLAFHAGLTSEPGSGGAKVAARETEAVRLARTTGDSRLLADALCAYIFQHTDVDHRAEYREAVAELGALDVSDHRGPMLSWGGFFVLRAAAALRDGDIVRFRALIDDMHAASTRSGNPEMRYHPVLWEALCFVLEGRWSDAEHRAADAVETLAGFNENFARLQLFSQLLPVRAAQGRLEEVEAILVAVGADRPDQEGLRLLSSCILASVRAKLERTEDARELVAGLVDHNPAVFDRRIEYWLALTSKLADACVDVGDEPRARAIYEQIADVTDINIVVGNASCDGSFDRALGRLAGFIGRWDEAEDHFTSARVMEQGLESPPLSARTDAHHAEMLLRANRTGDRERAEELLSDAWEVATRLEMRDLQHEIERLRAQ